MQFRAAALLLSFVVVRSAILVEQNDAPVVSKVIEVLKKLHTDISKELQDEKSSFLEKNNECNFVHKRQTKRKETEADKADKADATKKAAEAELGTLGEDKLRLEEESSSIANETELSEISHANALTLETHKCDKVKNGFDAVVDVKSKLEEQHKASKSFLQTRGATSASVLEAVAVIQSSGFVSYDQVQDIRAAVLGTPQDLKGQQTKETTSHLGVVIRILDDLEVMLQGKLDDCGAKKENIKNAAALAQQSWKAMNDANVKSLANNAEDTATQEAEHGEQATNLEAATGERDDAAGKIKENHKACTLMRREHKDFVAKMDGELGAITEAIKVLSEAADKRTPDYKGETLKESLFFLQLSSSSSPKRSDAVAKVMQLLNTRSIKEADARRLKLVLKANGPEMFVKVITMIQKMIVRLGQEQQAESEHKSWCDGEREMAKTKMEDFNSSVIALGLKREDLKDKIDEAKLKIKGCNEELSNIATAYAERTDDYNTQRQDREQSLHDVKITLDAIRNALYILRKHFAESQSKARPNHDEGGRVLTLLQETETSTLKFRDAIQTEEAQQKELFDELNSKADIEKATQTKTMQLAETKKAELQADLSATEKKFTLKDKERYNYEEYLKEINKACGELEEANEGYTNRKEARDAEIEALKKAKCILNDDPECAKDSNDSEETTVTLD